MSSGVAQQQSRLKELISRGREQGYLTYQDVNDHLPDDITDPEQIEDIIGMINDLGIAVHETAPDADDLLAEGDSTDEVAAEEAAAALVAVENEAGRTTDPVRMYMREMGTVELLTREGEIVIAKRIEEGIRDVLNAVSHFPGPVELTLDKFEATQKDEGKLADLLIGFLNPVENVIPAAQVVPGEKKEDDDSEENKGADPVLAAERFAILEKQFKKAERAIKKYDRSSTQGAKELEALGEAFQFFKFVPKHYDALVQMVRDTHGQIRRQERHIMNTCTRRAKMPRKVFLENFAGHEADMKWVPKQIKAGHSKLKKFEDDIFRAQKRIKQASERVGLEVIEIKDINRRMSIGEAKARRAKKDMVEAPVHSQKHKYG
jgi:RNA polymerase primary sigma factor